MQIKNFILPYILAHDPLKLVYLINVSTQCIIGNPRGNFKTNFTEF